MDYGALRDDSGNFIGGVITETDGKIFEERQRVQAVSELAQNEAKTLKSKEMEQHTKSITKLRERRAAVLGDIQKSIKKEMKDISVAEGIDHNDEMPIRELTHDELAKIESVNLLIFEAKKNLRAAQKDFYEKQLAENEKLKPSLEKKIQNAQAILQKSQDEHYKVNQIGREFQQWLNMIEKQPIEYYSKMQHLGELGSKQTLRSLMEF